MFYIYNVKKIACFLVFLSILFVSCDKGCTDENACNNGVTTEPCKYSDEQEAILEGEWTLKDVYDIDGVCLFSRSDDIDGEWEDNVEWINLDFDDDHTCEIETGPEQISENLFDVDWSIDACLEVLNFPSIDPVYTETNSSFPDYWPFGHFKIIELHGDTFNCEDLSGNILRWERV
mgnify:CR=1 FL=1